MTVAGVLASAGRLAAAAGTELVTADVDAGAALGPAVAAALLPVLLCAAALLTHASPTLAIEEPAHNVVERDGRFVLRDDAPTILAESVGDGVRERVDRGVQVRSERAGAEKGRGS